MAMGRKLSLLLFGLASCTPLSAFALGLGEINVKSYLNQPFNAEIELLQIRDLTTQEILPGLATREDFERAGVDRAYFLTGLHYEVVLRDNGTGFVRVTSRNPVKEPFLNFLVEVHWPAGKLLREYTILLDPPSFSQDAAQSVTPALSAAPQPQQTTPSTSTQASTTTTRTSTATESSASYGTPSYQEPSSTAQPTGAPSEYRISRSDNLWKVANTLKPASDVTVQQTMIAIQQQNPEAFINENINLLRAGQVIRAPSAEQVRQITRQEAIEEVARQTQAWKNRNVASQTPSEEIEEAQISGYEPTEEPASDTSSTGTLRLASAEEGATAGLAGEEGVSSAASGVEDTGAVKALENQLMVSQESLEREKLAKQDLELKVSDLQQQVTTGEKLLTLKDEQIVALQARLQELEEQKEKLAGQIENLQEAETAVAGTEDTAEMMTEETTAEEAPVEEIVDSEAEMAMEEPGEETTSEAEMDEMAAALEGVATEEDVDYNFAPEGEEEMVAEEMQPEEAEETMAEGEMAATEEAGMSEEGEVAPEAAMAPVSESPATAPEAEKVPEPKTGSVQTKQPASALPLPLPALIGIGVAVIVALGGVFMFLRNRKPATGEDELVADLEGGFSMDESLEEGMEAESGFEEAGMGDADFDEEFGEQHVEDDQETETKDVLGQADIYIAYRRLDQAKSFLEEAIQEDPVRADYRLKLLEVLAEAGDTDGFSQAEEELTALGDDDANNKAHELHDRLRVNAEKAGDVVESDASMDTAEADLEEEHTAIMHPVSEEDITGEAVDFESPIDFDLDDDATVLHEKTESQEFDTEVSDFDALDEGESFETAANELDEGLEFSLEDEIEDVEPEVGGLDQGIDFAIEDVEPEGEIDNDMDFSLEEPVAPEAPDNLVKLDEMGSTIDSNAAADIANEFEDDMDFDLDAGLDEAIADSEDDMLVPDVESSSVTSTLDEVADLSETTSEQPDLSLVGAEDDLSASLDTLDEELSAVTDDLTFDEPSLEEVAEAPELPSADNVDITSELALADKLDDELDDEELGFLSDSDETATKLDLARAYIDMGDRDGAKDILDEVMLEGNDDQQNEARNLLQKVENG